MALDAVQKQGLRQSMASLHTWVGLLPGWLLYIVFLFGTVAFFQVEISGWMRPELTRSGVSAQAIDAADALFRARAKGAESWSLRLPDDRGGSGLDLNWKMPGEGRGQGGRATLDPATGREVAVRDTRGGFFLYRMHFDLHYMPVMWARYLVSVAALAMLVAILSGVITHKKIFTDFFLLRFGKGQRSWLDAHNVTGVLALPFHLMMTYTGLVTLLFTLMPWAISANFPSVDAYYQAAFPRAPEVEASGKAAPVAPIAMLIAQARSAQPGFVPSYISVERPGDSTSVTQIYAASERLGRRSPPVLLDSASGAPLPSRREASGAARATQDVMVQLHRGAFSGIGLRWLYFLSGVGGTVMVASGLILWTVKRRAKLPDPNRPHFGFRLVERLNIGFIAGAPAGIAVYFLANRLLASDLEQRGAWEVDSLFIAWGALFVWTLGRPVKRAWSEALVLCAILYALVPLANALTTKRGLGPSLIAGDWVFAGFDLMMLTTAGLCGLAAFRVATRKAPATPRRKARQPAGEAA